MNYPMLFAFHLLRTPTASFGEQLYAALPHKWPVQQYQTHWEIHAIKQINAKFSWRISTWRIKGKIKVIYPHLERGTSPKLDNEFGLRGLKNGLQNLCYYFHDFLQLKRKWHELTKNVEFQRKIRVAIWLLILLFASEGCLNQSLGPQALKQHKPDPQ